MLPPCPEMPVDPTKSVVVDVYHSTEDRDDPHAGIDIAAPWGTAVRAMVPGHVVAATKNGQQGFNNYGISVVILQDDGLRALYAHLSQKNVRLGQRIDTGEIIGHVGATNGSNANPGTTIYDDPKRGTHLHLEVSKQGYPKPYDRGNIDPLRYLGNWGVNTKRAQLRSGKTVYRWQLSEAYKQCRKGDPFLRSDLEKKRKEKTRIKRSVSGGYTIFTFALFAGAIAYGAPKVAKGGKA